MIRSNKAHHTSNDIFMIKLKLKLHIEIFDTRALPTCLYGQASDVFAKHTFFYRRVSKMACHNRIGDNITPIIQQILLSANIISKGTKVYTKPKWRIAGLPSLQPFYIAAPSKVPTIGSSKPQASNDVALSMQ